MQVLHKVDLSKYTTMKIGGVADNFYIPESMDEMAELQKRLQKQEYYIISGGSNLLVNDQKNFNTVISLQQCNNEIVHEGNGEFRVGASVRIQKLIREAAHYGYGGIEFLYSLPAMLGGIIYMNAGRGKGCNEEISQFVLNVTYCENGRIQTIPVDECGFSYRYSSFHGGRGIILGAVVQLNPMTAELVDRKIQQRMEHVKQTQDKKGFNFGTLFCQADGKLLRLSKMIKKGNPNGVHFSYVRGNCLINEGAGTYSEAMDLIDRTIWLHKIFHRPYRLEVEIWK